MLAIKTSKDNDAPAIDNPISRMEDLGHSLLLASEALHGHAHNIALNAQQTNSILDRTQG